MRERPGQLIALSGPAGCGKSTLATAFVEHVRRGGGRAERLRFAGPLKSMLITLGLSPAQVDGNLKEEPCDLLCGKTPRHAMQTLGTEWGRMLIGEDVWARATLERADALREQDIHIVIDDCRFDNEARAIKAAGGSVVLISRDGAEASSAHASEVGVSPELIDYYIYNNGTVADALLALTLLLTT